MNSDIERRSMPMSLEGHYQGLDIKLIQKIMFFIF